MWHKDVVRKRFHVFIRAGHNNVFMQICFFCSFIMMMMIENETRHSLGLKNHADRTVGHRRCGMLMFRKGFGVVCGVSQCKSLGAGLRLLQQKRTGASKLLRHFHFKSLWHRVDGTTVIFNHCKVELICYRRPWSLITEITGVNIKMWPCRSRNDTSCLTKEKGADLWLHTGGSGLFSL